MKPAIYIERGGQRLQCGYTTGTCAAAAAKAAAEMLCGGRPVPQVRIRTPKGPVLLLETEYLVCTDKTASCAVKKFSGDDPDVTDGADICAAVSFAPGKEIRVDGGEGVGRVTRPGLDQPVGSAAINSVPRRMILENAEEVLKKYGLLGKTGLDIVISVPEGRALAEKTFNPKLGIVGGISILGTTGIVEPMSERAIVATVQAEINIRREEHYPLLPAAIGNYGLHFIEGKYKIPADTFVTTSNFIGDSMQLAARAGFSEILLIGHIGKLVKAAGGMRNTHSMYGDNRMEVIADAAVKYAPPEMRQDISDNIRKCVMTDAALDVLAKAGIRECVTLEIVSMAKAALEKWAGDGVSCEVIMFSNQYGALAETPGAEEMLARLEHFLAAGDAHRRSGSGIALQPRSMVISRSETDDVSKPADR